MDYIAKLDKAVESIKAKTDFAPKVGIVLGSGLGTFADQIKQEKVISYSEIEGFPVSTVVGHSGEFIFGYLGDVPVVAMKGRVHYYEGYEMTDVVLPIRLMGKLGIKALFLSNAAGGSNPDYNPGTLMMIRDHIMRVESPLIGKNDDRLGVRFPDMSNIYNNELCDIIINTAQKLDIPVEQGVYMQFSGPQYETPAEVKMATILGASAVGMSTACEAVAANHMGIKVCGVSCITNMAAGLNTAPLNHKEVQEVADMVAENFQKLVKESIIAIGAAV